MMGDGAHLVHYCRGQEPLRFSTIGAFTVIGQVPRATAANRRKVDASGAPVIVGGGVVIGPHCCIYCDVHLGDDTMVGNGASIREGTRIGDRCVIGCMVDIQYGVTIGNDVRILNQTQIAGGSVIGDGSFIGPGVQTANDKAPDLDDYQDRGQHGVTIGRKVFVGVGAILLPGVRIGDGARIAAGALVTKDVGAGETVFGLPGRVIYREPVEAWRDQCGAGGLSATELEKLG